MVITTPGDETTQVVGRVDVGEELAGIAQIGHRVGVERAHLDARLVEAVQGGLAAPGVGLECRERYER